MALQLRLSTRESFFGVRLLAASRPMARPFANQCMAILQQRNDGKTEEKCRSDHG